MSCCNDKPGFSGFEQIAFVPAPQVGIDNGNDVVLPDAMDNQGYLGMNNYFIQLAQARPRFPAGRPLLFGGQMPATVLPSAAEYRENAWILGQYT